jgi:acetylornithine deacetylase/succinyl-diaminopimelate desuccinylase-like protein
VANLIRYKKEGYVPERDLILALTADEELGSSSPWNGVSWLLKHHRALIEAEFALNEGGGAEMTREGRPVLLRVQAAEKVNVSFRLETKNPGGHSSLPRKDNAI